MVPAVMRSSVMDVTIGSIESRSRIALNRVAVLVLIGLAVVGALTVRAASAGAESIVFVKGGNVWLAAADGTSQRQVTTGGGWDAPSQADGGTILARRGTQLFRLDQAGKALAAAIDTLFTGAPATWVGPVDPVISPDGVNQAYDGEITDSGYYDYGCGCYVYTHTFATWWGSATGYSQPGQTLGQQDYDEPAWIDDSHLLMSSTGILIDQVATYTLGGGDNSLVQWFSDPDPSVQALASGAITRAGDKLAFVANVNGGVGNEIRIYSTTGPPPFVAGDPSNVPVDQCNIGPNNFQSLRVSFSPDGQSLAYDAPDGIHLVTLTGWPSCAGLTDRLIIPGGAEPYFGPANVPQNSTTTQNNHNHNHAHRSSVQGSSPPRPRRGCRPRPPHSGPLPARPREHLSFQARPRRRDQSAPRGRRDTAEQHQGQRRRGPTPAQAYASVSDPHEREENGSQPVVLGAIAPSGDPAAHASELASDLLYPPNHAKLPARDGALAHTVLRDLGATFPKLVRADANEPPYPSVSDKLQVVGATRRARGAVNVTPRKERPLCGVAPPVLELTVACALLPACPRPKRDPRGCWSLRHATSPPAAMPTGS